MSNNNSEVEYRVNLTDNTESPTRLSGIYHTSQCLSITPDLYPDVCGPFQLSVSAAGQQVITAPLSLLPPGKELDLCGCYQEKGSCSYYSSGF